MREVGAARGIPVIDTYAFVHSIPAWQQLMADGVHPGDEPFLRIARDLLYPALLPRVAEHLGESL